MLMVEAEHREENGDGNKININHFKRGFQLPEEMTGK